MIRALRTLAAHAGAMDRDDFRREIGREHPNAGEMLAMGAVSQGYARERGDRLVMTDAGYRCLDVLEPMADGR
jgi:hypothetical protein